MINKIKNKTTAQLIVLILIIVPLISLYSPERQEISAYTTHGPINISTDVDFVTYSFPGSGTAGDPYLIDNLQIITSDTYGIAITANTLTKYVTIQNCYIDAGTYGIFLIGSSLNGMITVRNNTLTGQSTGIFLAQNYQLITENIIYSNTGSGIQTGGGAFNNLTYNTCYNNSRGIDIRVNSDNNYIENNLCYDNTNYGIEIYDSNSNVVRNNTLRNNYAYGVYVEENFVTANNNEIYLNTFDTNNLVIGTSQGYDEGSNYWYSVALSVGNLYSDWAGSATYSIQGSAGALDLYPQEYPLTGPTITGVSHTPSSPTDIDSVEITATVTDISGISQVVVYFQNNFGGWYSVGMSDIGGNEYLHTFGGFSIGDTFEYYIQAYDNSYFTTESVDDNGGSYYQFTILSSDFTPPVISSVYGTPSKPYSHDAIYVFATVSDSSGIHNVTIHWRPKGTQTWYNFTMAAMGGGVYRHYSVTATDMIIEFEYYISAIDDSGNFNEAIEDNGGLFYSYTVLPEDLEGPTITDINQNPSSPTDVDSITISANVTDMSGIHNVTLHYRVDGGTWSTVSMTLSSPDIYSANIGSYSLGATIEYYISAIDDSPNNNETIEDNGGLYYSFTILSSDFSAPIISGVAINPSSFYDVEDVILSAIVTDASGIYNVTLHYRVNGGMWTTVLMTLSATDTYTVNIGTLTAGDTIEYYITALDDSGNFNEAMDDNGGSYYTISILSSDFTPPTITDVEHSPENPTPATDVRITASIADASDIYNITVYYRVNGGGWMSISMEEYIGVIYYADISGFSEGDFIEYYIVAVDDSGNYNIATEDNGGLYYSFSIVPLVPEFDISSAFIVIATIGMVLLPVLIVRRKK